MPNWEAKIQERQKISLSVLITDILTVFPQLKMFLCFHKTDFNNIILLTFLRKLGKKQCNKIQIQKTKMTHFQS